MTADRLHDAQWSRVLELIRTWPGAGRRLSPDELDAYRQAFESPRGDGGGAIADPLELELVVKRMILDDVKGARPSIGAVHRRLVELRQERLESSRSRRLAWAEQAAEPADDSTVAHAIFVGSPLAPLMRAVAQRHGRATNPPHDEALCPLCAISRAYAAFHDRQLTEHGPTYRLRYSYADDVREFELELANAYAWLRGAPANE